MRRLESVDEKNTDSFMRSIGPYLSSKMTGSQGITSSHVREPRTLPLAPR